MEIGQLVRVNIEVYNGQLIPKGVIAIMTSRHIEVPGAGNFEILLPYEFKGSKLSAYIRDTGPCDYKLEDILAQKYEYTIEKGEVMVKGKVNENITNEYLIKVFKYIPIRFQGTTGFIKDKETLFIYDYVSNNKGKYISTPRLIKHGLTNILKSFCVTPILENCKAKVINCEKSTKLFGKAGIKRSAIDKIFSIEDIILQAEVKNSSTLEDTVWLRIDDSKYRFALSDIQIIYPNINGFQEKKDRIIKKGLLVRCINDKHLTKLKRNDKIIVDHIKTVGNKQYIGFVDNNEMQYINKDKFKVV